MNSYFEFIYLLSFTPHYYHVHSPSQWASMNTATDINASTGVISTHNTASNSRTIIIHHSDTSTLRLTAGDHAVLPYIH